MHYANDWGVYTTAAVRTIIVECICALQYVPILYYYTILNTGILAIRAQPLRTVLLLIECDVEAAATVVRFPYMHLYININENIYLKTHLQVCIVHDKACGVSTRIPLNKSIRGNEKKKDFYPFISLVFWLQSTIYLDFGCRGI